MHDILAICERAVPRRLQTNVVTNGGQTRNERPTSVLSTHCRIHMIDNVNLKKMWACGHRQSMLQYVGTTNAVMYVQSHGM
jgi:hypothetical protein